jgi:hypothetical protein
MATSNSFNFSVNRLDVVTSALEETGAIDVGSSPSPEMDVYCTKQLNLLLKNWGGQGLNLWRIKRTVLLLETEKIQYSLDSDGDHWVLESGVNETFINGDQTISGAATAITVDSTSGMAASDYLGVELEDGSIQWTTISSVGSSTSVTPAASWTDDVDNNAHVYWYTNKAPAPLHLLDGTRRTPTNSSTGEPGFDTPINLLARHDYARLGFKRAEGTPIEVYFDPQPDDPLLFVYPEPNDVGYRLRFNAVMPWDDMDTDDDTFGCHQAWYLPIILGLSRRIAGQVGCSKGRHERIERDFQESLIYAYRADREKGTSLFIVPDSEMR